MSTRVAPRRIGGKQILDYSEVGQLLRQGKTQLEVATLFGVTQAAISQARRRGNVRDGDTRNMGSLPWDVRPQHQSQFIPKMLRCAARVEAGHTIGVSLQPQLAVFLRSLTELDAVIHYDPELTPPFVRVPRRQGVDTWLVRDPHLDDDGNPI